MKTLVLFLLTSTICLASGARFVTGATYSGAAAGKRMAWYTPNVTYYTDSGDLNANVPHAQADAMVAAAAAPWNVPTALLTLAQGGTLGEHISDQNTYFNGTALVWPADVMATNYLSKPIAIIYDTNGSVTDMLLGSGTSDPTACHHNAVTESVDSFGQTGTIQHAVIILNGRCVGSAPEQLNQMQYQLERIFGRVLGLAWSQCNDNVFTAATTVTAAQQAAWPIMHPIDVLCGTYTYQCLRYPFQLRTDDIASLALLYPVTAANIVPGKSLTVDANSMSIDTTMMFPNLMQMEGMNITLTWSILGITSPPYQTASSVSGSTFARMVTTSVTGVVPASENAGSTNTGLQGFSTISRLPLNFTGNRVNVITLTAESINPLYSGEYAVGIYKGAPLALYGASTLGGGIVSYGNWDYNTFLYAPSEPNTCAPGNDGSSTMPVSADPSGWWTGQICGVGHVAYPMLTVRAGRTFTVEVTALDETGIATTRKLRPAIAVWKKTDLTSAAPVVSAITPMNSMSVGMTQLHVPSFAAALALRIGITDAYGSGRPDFAYKARLLYADSVAPTTVGRGGGLITITGMGFRAGNQVLINGVVATVTSWTSTQIVATVPALTAANATVGTAVDVTVTDTGTGGTTTMSSALVYTTVTNSITLLSAPSTLETGVKAATPFAVKVLGSDGVTPMNAATVQLVINGGVSLAACGAATQCIVTTDANGMVSTIVTGTLAGSATVTATEMGSGSSVSATMQVQDPLRTLTTTATTHYLAAGATSSWPITVFAQQDGVAASAVIIAWSNSGGAIVTGAQITDSNGAASAVVKVTSITGNSLATATACAWTSVCAAIQIVGVAQPQWAVAVSSGAGQSVKTGTALLPVTMQLTDSAGHALEGATVQVYQADEAWQAACPTHGACPATPVIAKSTTTLVSDANGNITITPFVTPGVPQVVNIAASTGTQGFVTMTLNVAP